MVFEKDGLQPENVEPNTMGTSSTKSAGHDAHPIR